MSTRVPPGAPIRVAASGRERAMDAPLPVSIRGLREDPWANLPGRGLGTGRTRRPDEESRAYNPTDPFRFSDLSTNQISAERRSHLYILSSSRAAVREGAPADKRMFPSKPAMPAAWSRWMKVDAHVRGAWSGDRQGIIARRTIPHHIRSQGRRIAQRRLSALGTLR